MARDKTKNRDPFGSRYSQNEEPSETETQDTPSKTGKSDNFSETGKTDTPSKTSKKDNPEQTEEKKKSSVKDRPSVLMYLPEEQHTELDIRFDEINARYKREHGEPLQKNRDYYPILIELAMEKTQEMDEDELLSRLNQS
ncbi:hypothetical protein SAMN05421858_3239 [Haladaptatus litoreus]|uniref:DUF8160 domain-containing protein n=1 Tax=Haladaptatus litoreus TaxID=553468 RepID=A0A1N7CT44_9EURY|nr:hypothetical protein [Haladaptatus litoreus]SIR66836.1 hypothetical protein SAMN05421858_3239 [Haladaptatus litoreus]